jgi:hypothetical protein
MPDINEETVRNYFEFNKPIDIKTGQNLMSLLLRKIKIDLYV